ncbi:DUF7312 domain-containing protein [Halodesulfurarchaeum formicicum]|uniref:DUF7312 domain-containing protein n=1 Tax=Halodesulfurarchaeum formicicum TaxID=1873524 RepID=UPI000ACBBF7E|nr:hypothetical protein [Halodesulfurarchaeum formicicum]
MSDWKFEVDEVGPEAEPEVPEIEPGNPRLEHVLPFLLGVGLAIAILVVSL